MSNSKSPLVIPKHVAVIMDGNGRWATQRGFSRSKGHEEGSKAIDRLMDTALELGLANVSLYAFSTENWKRPVTEISAIFNLLLEFIDSRLEDIDKKGIRVMHSGAKTRLSKKVQGQIQKAVDRTSKNRKLTVNFCLNYGSRDEIAKACEGLIRNRIENGINLEKPIKEKELEKYLYTRELPPVDLLIRTAGERRLSNFLLWQCAYAELYFTDTLWPDFSRESLLEALESYSRRTRKFGGL